MRYMFIVIDMLANALHIKSQSLSGVFRPGYDMGYNSDKVFPWAL